MVQISSQPPLQQQQLLCTSLQSLQAIRTVPEMRHCATPPLHFVLLLLLLLLLCVLSRSILQDWVACRHVHAGACGADDVQHPRIPAEWVASNRCHHLLSTHKGPLRTSSHEGTVVVEVVGRGVNNGGCVCMCRATSSCTVLGLSLSCRSCRPQAPPGTSSKSWAHPMLAYPTRITPRPQCICAWDAPQPSLIHVCSLDTSQPPDVAWPPACLPTVFAHDSCRSCSWQS